MTRKILMHSALLASVGVVLPFSAQAQSVGTPVTGTPSQTPSPAPSAADASAQANDDERGIDDIVVTARRTEENLQTTPVAVTALGTEQLEQAQVVNQVDLQRTTPSLVVSKGAPSSSGFVYVSIRGQGNLNPGVANDPAVGTYFDGVYIARPSQGITDLQDIERAEILRGPQGTLFGRNTTGGALNLISNDPTGRFEASVKGEYGNYDAWSAGAVVNLPFKSDEAGLRLVYNHSQHDGFAHNAYLDRDQNDSKSDFVRGKLRFNPGGGAFSITLAGDYNHITDSGAANSFSGANGAAPTAIFRAALAPQFGPAAALIDLSGVYGQLNQYLHTENNWYTGYGKGFAIGSTPNGGRLPYDKLTAWGGSATMSLDLDSVNIKSITAYRDSYNEGLIDLDATPVDILTTRSGYKSKAFSQEFQVSGDIGDRFNYIGGLYYSRETGFEFSDFQTFGFLNRYLESFVEGLQGLPAGTLAGTFGPPLTGQNYADVVNTTTSAYAQGYYKLTDKLRVAAGIRWTWDQRDVVLRNVQQVGLPYGAIIPSTGTPNCANPTGDPSVCRLERSARFDYPAYTFGVDYQASDQLFVYAKTSRASKAGGWNLRQGSESTPAFAPETARDIEGGFKYTTPNRMFRLNAAAFYTWTSGVQRNSSGVVNGTSTQFVRNAGKTEIYGAEFEATARPIESLVLTANLALLDGHYVEGSFFDDLGGGVITDRSAEPLPQLPHIQFGVGATQTIPVSFGEISLHADYAYVGHQSFSSSTPPPGSSAAVVAQYQVENDLSDIPGYGLLNGRIGATIGDKIEIYAFGRNLLQKKYLVHAFPDLYTSVGVATEYIGDPRTYGLGVKFTF